MKMKVLHIITHFDVGGAERVAINIAKSNSKDFEYHIMEVARAKGTFTKQLIQECKDDDIKIHRSLIGNSKFAILLFPFVLLFHTIKIHPDIIHSHTEIPDLSIYLWKKTFGHFFSKIKYIRTIHNTQLWNKCKRIGDKVENFFKKETTTITISTSTRQYYLTEFKIKTPIIYNGIEEIKQIPFKGIVPNRINILFAGRLEPQKGVDILINVIKSLKHDSRFIFHVVGVGSMADKVNELCDFDNVRLYNKIYGLSSYLASFDYLFMPSVHEGLALMPIEASFAKVPTIINRCPGLKDTLPEDWVLAIDNNDIDKLILLFNNLENMHREELGIKAYNFALENFTVQKMQKEYESIYLNA